jgi:hypothetical protein
LAVFFGSQVFEGVNDNGERLGKSPNYFGFFVKTLSSLKVKIDK